MLAVKVFLTQHNTAGSKMVILELPGLRNEVYTLKVESVKNVYTSKVLISR
jgi:hypothetical protein